MQDKEVLVMTKRVIFGKDRKVLPPDPKKAIQLSDIDPSVLKRIIKRNCGVIVTQKEFDSSIKDGEK